MAILQTHEVAEYLRQTGLVPRDASPRVERLPGGVSSAVFRATWDNTAVVVKQAMPQLQVQDEWLSRVERSATEARAATVLQRLLPPGSILAPLHVDEQRSLFVMPSAPAAAETWKALLMRRELSTDTARVVGELLRMLHEGSRNDTGIAQTFADRQDFVALRVDPYLRVTAERRPHLATAIDRHTQRMLSTQECLVHGDFSPKNMLLEPDHPRAVILLDHEVCHWGDPSFDTAFCLTHLHLKACTFPDRASGFLDLARAFWTTYGGDAALERDTVCMLGCLLAARVDGKSPAEYLTTEELRQRVRRLAEGILLDEPRTLDEVRALTLVS